jgi:Na+/H+-dicarboxylate symporter/ABC-type amino acid transport substrate-binding protein
MSLALQMAIATVLGILVGLFLGDICQVFAPWSNAYVMILKITILPYLVGAIIHGLGTLSKAQAQQILKRGILFITLAWVINLSMVYVLNFSFPKAKGGTQTGFISTTPPSINFAELLIPENIFHALSNNIVPAVVIFSVLVGMALMYLKQKEILMSSLETLVDALTRVTSWISRITPFGTFLIMAQQAGTIQPATVKQVSTYLILFIIGTSLITFWIFPRLVSMLTRLPALRWLKLFSPVLLLAYTTNVVIVCLPYIMEIVRKETSELYPHDEKAQSPIQGIVSVVFNLPLASLFVIVYILFSALFYQTPLNFIEHIQLILTTFLTSLGAIGLGSWLNSLNFLLDTLNMPEDALKLYLTILPFVSGFQSMLSAMQIGALSLFITLACRNLITWKIGKILKSSLITLTPIFLIFAGLKFFAILPPVERNVKSICELHISSDLVTKIYSDSDLNTLPLRNHKEDLLTQILNTKTLRVGYHNDAPPFSFMNSEKQIVGYDIAFAYALAHDLDCTLELIPIEYSSLEQDLGRGLFDIGMSAITITTERLKTLCFTKPYIESKIVLVFKKTHLKKYSSFTAIESNEDVKIAVLKGSSYISLAKELFPNKEMILLDNYEQFATQYSDDVLLWQEQESISWILRHPQFHILFTKKFLGIDSLSYAIAQNDDRFLCYLNQWLLLKKNQGFTERMYDLWILGQTEKATKQPPRFSIIRDVLHWTK